MLVSGVLRNLVSDGAGRDPKSLGLDLSGRLKMIQLANGSIVTTLNGLKAT